MFTKIIRFGKKVLQGQPLVKIKYSPIEWDAQFNKGNWDFLLERHQNIVLIAQILKDSIASKHSLAVLDVGCGNGALIKELAGLSFEYTGIDISRAALEQAKQYAPTGTFIQASMDDAPPVTGTYDVIVFCEVLLYGDYEKILKRYQPHLRPGGQIIISLYDAWRTKIIWYELRHMISTQLWVYVKNKTRNVGWNICVGTYR